MAFTPVYHSPNEPPWENQQLGTNATKATRCIVSEACSLVLKNKHESGLQIVRRG